MCISTHAQEVNDAETEQYLSFVEKTEERFDASGKKEFKDITKELFSRLEQENPEAFFEPLIESSKQMDKFDLSIYPYFYEFYRCYFALYDQFDSKVMQNWLVISQEYLKNIENNRYKKFEELLSATYLLVTENKLVDSRAGSTWQVSKIEPTFLIDTLGRFGFELTPMDLSAIYKSDSLVVNGTRGSFFPEDKEWIGNGGKISWWRYNREDIYCTFEHYTIDMKRPFVRINEVLLIHPDLFPGQELKGSLEDKVYSVTEDEGNYPKFDGSEGSKSIDRLIKDVLIDGAFSLHGSFIYSTAVDGINAKLAVADNQGEILLRSQSPRYKLSSDRIFAKSASVSIYLDKLDSIYHPAVSLDYSPQEAELKLSKGEGLEAASPFKDTYHGYDFMAEDIIYFPQSDSLWIGKKSMGLAKVSKDVIFESPNYYNQSEYLSTQNIGSINPIARLSNLVNSTHTREFNLSSVIEAINPKLNKTSIQTLLLELVREGFVSYDPSEDLVLVRDKTIHYSEASKNNKDFDHFRIGSKSKDENAVLDLKNLDFTLNGVQSVNFSDSQSVAILPYFKEIILKQDNELLIHGKLYAGYSTYEGMNFRYDYTNHKIKMDSVKTFQLYIPTGKKMNEGEDEAVSVTSQIEDMKATLIVDGPNNKSGMSNIEIFPSLHTEGDCYVYYDRSSIQGGLYTRDSFYFRLDEFDIIALDDLDSNHIIFSGDLRSKNIFPIFSDSLELRSDRSLGMVHEVRDNPYSLYIDKGAFVGIIDLSNAGLMGDGTVSYLEADFDSEEVTFLPSQLLASAELFDLPPNSKPNEELPKINAKDVDIDWRPYRDSLYIKSAEAPFAFYDSGVHLFRGTVIYTPSGIKGDGNLDWNAGTVASELINFGYDNLSADTMNLNIKAAEGDDLAFDSKNLNGSIDFGDQMGYFQGNSKEINTYMPANRFKTNFNDFDWQMEQELVIFKDVDGKDGIFISTDPEKDSLDIIANRARYELKNSTLTLNNVPYILVADAYVYPSDSTVIIRKNGVIDSLVNASIVADKYNQYHQIERAKVAILGKKDYTAEGYYSYDLAGRDQEFYLDNIVGARVGKGKRSEKNTETRASGVVSAEDEFYIDEKTQFQGSISFSAIKPALTFKGHARFALEGLKSDSTWFSIHTVGDKNNLLLRYDTPKTLDDQPTRTGIFINKESAFVYPAIFRPLFNRKDRPLIEVLGIVDYQPERKELVMGDSLFVVGKTHQGNMLRFFEGTGAVEAIGKVNICSESPLVQHTAYGKIKTTDAPVVYDSLGFASLDSRTEIKLMHGVNFYIPSPLKKHIVKELSETLTSALDAKYDDVFYDEVATQFIEDKDKLSAFNEQLLLGNMVIPDDYNSFDFLFGKVPFQWIAETQSLMSQAKNLPLISMDQLGIHKKLECYLEYIMPSNGDDRAYCYLVLPNGNYYFFGVKDEILYTVSNNTGYNEKVEGLKRGDRTIKVDNEYSMEVLLSDPSTAQRFKNRVKGYME